MTVLLAIDPGERVGWARFVDGKLEACNVIRLAAAMFETCDQCVIETPRYRPHSPIDPNDLIKLALRTGQLIERMTPLAKEVELVEPQRWKGSVPKEIHHLRMTKKLDERERVIVQSSHAWTFEFRHNMLDAIGIGLWKLGRGR